VRVRLDTPITVHLCNVKLYFCLMKNVLSTVAKKRAVSQSPLLECVRGNCNKGMQSKLFFWSIKIICSTYVLELQIKTAVSPVHSSTILPIFVFIFHLNICCPVCNIAIVCCSLGVLILVWSNCNIHYPASLP
jgi:hypothetical protein